MSLFLANMRSSNDYKSTESCNNIILCHSSRSHSLIRMFEVKHMTNSGGGLFNFGKKEHFVIVRNIMHQIRTVLWDFILLLLLHLHVPLDYKIDYSKPSNDANLNEKPCS